jgi:hypothetical protein
MLYFPLETAAEGWARIAAAYDEACERDRDDSRPDGADGAP